MKSYINKKERNNKQGGETKNMSRRFLSLILAFALIFSLPLNAFANGLERSGDVNLNTPTIHGDFDFDSSVEQKVIVEFVDEPVVVYQQSTSKAGYSAEAYETLILSAQQSFKRSIQDNGIDADILHSYQTVFNGMAVSIPGDEIDEMVKIPGVKAIYPVVTYHVSPVPTTATSPNMDNSAPFIGVTPELQTTLNGEGVNVGIIDTGVDYNHPDLADQFELSGNLGYDIVDNDEDPMETLPGNPDEEETYHGTHVAGTIAYIAPEASLYAYRVLGPGGWGSTEDVIAGIEKAVADGMDVINLSLGDPTNSSDDASAIAINNAMDGGVVAVVSNGNDGPEDWSVGSPATSLKAISVGASTPPLEVPIINYGATSPIYTELMSFSPGIDSLSGEYQLEYVGLGTTEEVSGLDLTGKIALIQRGSITFAEKSINAQTKGAVAAIIFNNADGSFGGTLGESGDYIPTLSISGLDGQELLDQINGNPDFMISFSTIVESDLVAEFSSRGPVMDNLTMKPDVVAPGVDIYSTVPYYVVGNDEGDYTDAYASLQGTSMAAPHVAGVSALLLQKYPDWTPYDVKAALMNNAKQLLDRNDERYGLNEQGAGRIDVTKTLDATVIAEVYEEANILGQLVNYYSGSISFGQVSVSDDVYRTVVVKEVYGETQNFTVDVVWYTPVTGTGTTVTIDVYEADRVTADVYDEFKVDPYGSAQFEVGLSVGNDISDGYYEGAIQISDSVSGQTLLVPFSFYIGDIELPNPITSVFYGNPDFNWEITNQLPVEYNVYYRTRTDGIYTYLFNAQDDSFIGFVNSEDPTEPGEYEYSFDSYIPVDGLEPVSLPDGDYILYLESAVNEDHFNYSYLTVDRESPQIMLDNGMEQTTSLSSISQLTGQVNDLLIDIEYPDLTSVSYAVYAGENLSVNWTELEFNSDGTFTISNIPLEMGENKVVFNTEDAAGNSGTQEATINRVSSGSSSGAPSGGVVTDVPAQEEAEKVVVPLQNKETTTLTLQNGLTLQIPSNAVGLENAQVQVTKASEDDTEELLKTLSLGKDVKAFGQFYDFNILDENGEVVDHPTFKTSVTVSIPVDELDTGDLNKEKLSLFKILDDGTVKLIGGRVENGVLTAQLNSFSRYIVMAQDKKFTDVHERNYPWAVNEIEVLASKDIITGRTDTAFDPAANITRAEFTALLVRVLGLQAAEGTNVAFNDVSEKAWYHDAVKAAVSNGVIKGYNESVFAPDKNITRAEMAVIIGRALNQLGISKESQEVLSMFEDKENIRSWAVDGVSTVVSTGIMQGRSSDRFVAEELTTRAEAAVVIYRLFNQQYLK